MDDLKAKQHLQDMVDNIARDIQYGITFEDAGMDAGEFDSEPHALISGHDYLADAMDINYVVTQDAQYLGARILVAFGGPNIWIDTRAGLVQGHWWGDSVTARIDGDSMGLDECLSELWEYSK
tara:strand:- start:137 stop:505 length:369 start_codon:yes stop_codon:yes gene_type:complete